MPLSRALAPGFELWCPDLPGHGARSDEPFVLERAVADVATLVAAAAPRPAILAGDSLGGYVALAAAATQPRGVAAVVAGGCTWSMTGLGGALARLSDVPPELLARALGPRRTRRLFEALVARVCAPDDARAIVRAGVRVASRGESLRELAGLDLVAVVRALAMPVVFVNGRFDWPTRAGEGALLRAARDGRLVVSPRSGHGVGIFDPPAFARAIACATAPSATARAARSYRNPRPRNPSP